MSFTQERKDELAVAKKARHARILELAQGLTRYEIIAQMTDMGVREDTLFNDISLLRNEGKLRAERGAALVKYWRVSQFNPDEVLENSPVAMWGGYGAVKPAEGRAYYSEDFVNRSEPLKKHRAHISGGSLEMIA
jgi:hypothetical protein